MAGQHNHLTSCVSLGNDGHRKTSQTKITRDKQSSADMEDVEG